MVELSGGVPDLVRDWLADAVGDFTDGSAMMSKAAGMAADTAKGLYTGTLAFLEDILWE